MSEIGNVYGRLTVTNFFGLNHRKKRIWVTSCSCGTKDKNVLENNLRTGHTLSCGCLQKEQTSKARKIHGLTTSIEYKVWTGMHTRCYNKKCKSYADYGGRGIIVSQEWHTFSNFLNDMGLRPSAYHSIERIDNNAPYSLKNCKWALKKEQSGNKRNSIMITYKDKTQCLSYWCDELNLKYANVYARIKYASTPLAALEKAIAKSIRHQNR